MDYDVINMEEVKTESTSVLIELPEEHVRGVFSTLLVEVNIFPIDRLPSNKKWIVYFYIRHAWEPFYEKFNYNIIASTVSLSELGGNVRGARWFVEVVPWDQVPEWLPDAEGKTWAEYGNLALRWEQWYYSLHDRLSGHTVWGHSQDVFKYPLKATDIAILLWNWYTILNPEEFSLLNTDE